MADGYKKKLPLSAAMRPGGFGTVAAPKAGAISAGGGGFKAPVAPKMPVAPKAPGLSSKALPKLPKMPGLPKIPKFR